jgi:hypothetical protein
MEHNNPKSVFPYQAKFASSLRSGVCLSQPSKHPYKPTADDPSYLQLATYPLPTLCEQTAMAPSVKSHKSQTQELHRLLKLRTIVRRWREVAQARRKEVVAKRVIRGLRGKENMTWCATYSEYCKCQKCQQTKAAFKDITPKRK